MNPAVWEPLSVTILCREAVMLVLNRLQNRLEIKPSEIEGPLRQFDSRIEFLDLTVQQIKELGQIINRLSVQAMLKKIAK